MQTPVLDNLRRLFEGPRPPTPGVYHYRREADGRLLRLHLRIDADGSGLLMINASGILHMNASAALLMKLILDGVPRGDAVRAVRGLYRATGAALEADYDKVLGIVTRIQQSEDACPVWSLEVGDAEPFQHKVSAPYRADLALTYECNNRCIHCYVARQPDEKKSLSLDQWKDVLGRLWDVGVPHICFTGGEATLSRYLVELIERAEDLGQITGLLTNGRRLSDRAFTHQLCQAGLDHVQITLESHDERIHDEMVGAGGAFQETVEGIRNALAEDLYMVTNTTLCRLNVDSIEDTLRFLSQLGVRQFAMNSFIQTGAAPGCGEGLAEHELEMVIPRVTATARELGLRLIWYTPTHYCDFDPVGFGVGFKRCTAGEYNICIEPDGEVIPCQSYYEPAGNILTDPWDRIWNSPLFTAIRTRANAPAECKTCPKFSTCGAGCPLSKGDRFLCADSLSEM